MSLKQLSLARYKITLRIKENLILPAYKGSTLRGGFGSVFRKTVCISRGKDCSNCPLKDKCIYSYIFETSPPSTSTRLSKYESIPRPFILEPPLEEKRKYRAGESLSFNLILIGRAIDYLPYLILAFLQLGEVGLGREKARYEVVSVESIGESSKDPPETNVIYDGQTQRLKNVNAQIDLSRIVSLSRTFGDFLTLKFITPTRIKYQGSYTSHPQFHIILRSLLRRISSLLYFHCGEELEVNYREMIKEAERVRTLEARVDWIDWERYSGRQERRMKLGGFVGRVSYQGNIGKFLPFLKIGEYTHLGKAAVFGLGKYEIEKN